MREAGGLLDGGCEVRGGFFLCRASGSLKKDILNLVCEVKVIYRMWKFEAFTFDGVEIEKGHFSASSWIVDDFEAIGV